MASTSFYQDLPPLEVPTGEVLKHRQYFHLLPSDWQVVVTDIKDSTHAFRAGKYREINLLASSCVIAVLNLAEKKGVEVPFIYGGDGASFAVPPTLIQPVLLALVDLSQLAQKVFGLTLRVGSLEVREIEQADHLLKVAKLYVAPGYNQALFLDDGLAYAEKLIKDDETHQVQDKLIGTAVNLDGLECRWSPVSAPDHGPEIMCLIVYATDAKRHDEIYHQILADIDQIYGDFVERHPLHHRSLPYRLNWQQLGWESSVRYGHKRFWHLIKLAAQTWWRHWQLSHQDKLQLIAASDVLKLDGSLKTMVAGTPEQHQELISRLQLAESLGVLSFGHALMSNSFVTCYVPQAGQAINFLDGAGGGYIRAASELKQKLKALN